MTWLGHAGAGAPSRRLLALLPSLTIVVQAAACEPESAAGSLSAQMDTADRYVGPPQVRPVDGGPDYYEQFQNGLPTSADFFPVGVWFESVLAPEDTAKDRMLGLNTYVELTTNSDLELADEAGMSTVLSWGQEQTNGFLVTDEPDMWAGPGSASWTGAYPGEGDICRPAGSSCGYTVVETLLQDAPSGHMTYANYGKGVAFWQSDAEGARFFDLVDLASVDTYWFTDPNICGGAEGGSVLGDGRPLGETDCRRAANYGWTVERARSLVHPPGSKPVWLFVEVGHPAGEASAPTISGAQIRAAVWSGIIHGARGIIYFNHSFGGDCVSQHVLRDACGDAVRADVAALNQQIHNLAPVLNSPFVDGLLPATDGVDTAVKLHDGDLTVLAGSTTDDPREVTFTLPCPDATLSVVVGEDRTLPVVNGTFTDTFHDANTVHIYRLVGEACGLT